MVMWIARDMNGELFLYGTKPVRGEDGYWKTDYESGCIKLDEKGFPGIRWDDKEPVEVKVSIEVIDYKGT